MKYMLGGVMKNYNLNLFFVISTLSQAQTSQLEYRPFSVCNIVKDGVESASFECLLDAGEKPGTLLGFRSNNL